MALGSSTSLTLMRLPLSFVCRAGSNRQDRSTERTEPWRHVSHQVFLRSIHGAGIGGILDSVATG